MGRCAVSQDAEKTLKGRDCVSTLQKMKSRRTKERRKKERRKKKREDVCTSDHLGPADRLVEHVKCAQCYYAVINNHNPEASLLLIKMFLKPRLFCATNRDHTYRSASV